eukprot:508839-Rhodomonas_salina.4
MAPPHRGSPPQCLRCHGQGRQRPHLWKIHCGKLSAIKVWIVMLHESFVVPLEGPVSPSRQLHEKSRRA